MISKGQLLIIGDGPVKNIRKKCTLGLILGVISVVPLCWKYILIYYTVFIVYVSIDYGHFESE